MLKTLKSGIIPGIRGWKVSGKHSAPFFPYGKYPCEKRQYAILYLFEQALYKMASVFLLFAIFQNCHAFPGFFQFENMEFSLLDKAARRVFLIFRSVAHCFQAAFQEWFLTFHNGWIKCWKLIKGGVILLKIFHVPSKCPLEKFSTIRKMGKTDSGKTISLPGIVGKWWKLRN